MRRALLLLLVLAGTALAQNMLLPPRLGYVRDAGGLLRPVMGVRANFVLGEAAAENALSAAFSGRAGLVKTADEVLVLDGGGTVVSRHPAARGGALFAFSEDGAPALAYLRESAELFRFQDDRLEPVSHWLDGLDGELVAMAAPRRGGVALVLQRPGQLWLLDLSAVTGRVRSQTMLPGVSNPLLVRPDGTLLFQDESELVIRKPQGAEQRISLAAAVVQLEQMGDDWVHIVTASGAPPMALRLAASEAQLYQLPGAAR